MIAVLALVVLAQISATVPVAGEGYSSDTGCASYTSPDGGQQASCFAAQAAASLLAKYQARPPMQVRPASAAARCLTGDGRTRTRETGSSATRSCGSMSASQPTAARVAQVAHVSLTAPHMCMWTMQANGIETVCEWALQMGGKDRWVGTPNVTCGPQTGPGSHRRGGGGHIPAVRKWSRSGLIYRLCSS